MAYTPTTPPVFLDPFAERISDLTVEQINRPFDTMGMGPKVSQLSPLLQAAQQRTATQAGLGSLQYNPQGEVTGIGQGTGVAAFEPYLQRAESLTAPTAYQDYMSPYQQEVIDATQALLNEQRATGLNTIRGSQVAQGAFGQGRGQVAEAEYLRGRDISDTGTLAALRQEGLSQAQRLQQQALSNQLGLGQQQQAFESGITSQLGGTGAGSQAYSQSILDAIQQQNILNETFPLQRLGTAQNIFSGIASGTPSQPGQPVMTNPALAGVQTLASIYGALNPSARQGAAAGGLMSLLSSLGV
jgi:hypothetical protein